MIWVSTQRGELGWGILQKTMGRRPSYKELKKLVDGATELVFKEQEDCGMIFVQNKADCENLMIAYEWVGYHAEIEDKGGADRRWHHGEGSSHWMVATSSFMNGVDYGAIWVVIFFGACDGMMDLVQGGG